MTTINRMIPEGSEAVTREGVNAVVYFFTNHYGQICAVAYQGKRSKPTYRYRYTSEESRAQSAEVFFDSVQAQQERRSAAQKARKSFSHSLSVGDVLYCSWGYEQTNINWFEVVEVKSEKTVVIREICGDYTETNYMQGHTTPVKGAYKGEPMTKRVSEGNRVKIYSHASAGPWDGREKHYSSYH